MNDDTYINNWVSEFVSSYKYGDSKVSKNIDTFLDTIKDHIEVYSIIDKFISILNNKFAKNLNTNRIIATIEKDTYSKIISPAILDLNAINEIINFADGSTIIGDGLWTKLIKILGPKIITSTENVLFMCCLQYNDKSAFSTLNNFQGNKFIFIGEDHNTITANDAFYDLLEEKWTKVKHVFIPIWSGSYDYVQMYERKV